MRAGFSFERAIAPVVTRSEISYQRCSMTKLPRAIIVFLITLTCVGCDQTTKLVAKRHLQHGPAYSYAGDTVRIIYAENTGAFLSLGASLPEPLRQLIFTVLVGFFLVGLIVFVLLSRELSPFAVNCLSLVAAGGVSNLIDRIAYDGCVIDFLNVGIGPLRTGIFNLADMAITFGALFMLLDNFRPGKSSTST
jgi:signal peptidase II